MTYCVGMLLDTGLVFLSDSRTSAGVDHISTFRKTTVFQLPGDRVMVLLAHRRQSSARAISSMRSLRYSEIGVNRNRYFRSRLQHRVRQRSGSGSGRHRRFPSL